MPKKTAAHIAHDEWTSFIRTTVQPARPVSFPITLHGTLTVFHGEHRIVKFSHTIERVFNDWDEAQAAIDAAHEDKPWVASGFHDFRLIDASGKGVPRRDWGWRLASNGYAVCECSGCGTWGHEDTECC